MPKRFVFLPHSFSGCPLHDPSWPSLLEGADTLEEMQQWALERLNEQAIDQVYDTHGELDIEFVYQSEHHHHSGITCLVNGQKVRQTYDVGEKSPEWGPV